MSKSKLKPAKSMVNPVFPSEIQDPEIPMEESPSADSVNLLEPDLDEGSFGSQSHLSSLASMPYFDLHDRFRLALASLPSNDPLGAIANHLSNEMLLIPDYADPQLIPYYLLNSIEVLRICCTQSNINDSIIIDIMREVAQAGLSFTEETDIPLDVYFIKNSSFKISPEPTDN